MNCPICDKPIDLSKDGLNTFEDKPAHNDCYFEKLGDGIEQNPITTPTLLKPK